MSQKTQISRRPDMPAPQAAPAVPQADNSFYTQSSDAMEGRTFIPGMKRKSSGQADGASQNEPKPLHIELQQRPVAGLLYSVSGNTLGEIFPVYIGRNSIGNKPESDIYLSEMTVEPDHALLLIRKLNLPDGGRKVTMSISDRGSEFGTWVNGQAFEEDVVSINSGDTIRIGAAYTFVFISLDSDLFGLFPSENFRPTPRVESKPSLNVDYSAYINVPVDNTVYPDAVGEEDEMTFYGRSIAKKDDHSSKKTL